jgi:hypothetical protein
MNVQRAPTAMAEHRDRRGPARLRGRGLLLARGAWVALVALTLAIFFASLPVYLAQLRTVCVGTYGAGGVGCAWVQLSPEQAAVLQGVGFSPGAYAAYTLALTLATIAAGLAVSALIAWRGSDDRMALLVALMLVTLGPVWVAPAMPATSPLQVPNECLSFLFVALFVLVFSLFPSGRLVPRWTRWILVVLLVGQVPASFPNAPFATNFLAGTLGWLAQLGGGALLVAVQVYRYRRVSSPLQRQQTKWVVIGLAAPMTVYVGGTLLSLIVPALAAPSSPSGAPYQMALNTIGYCLVLLLPLAFGFAMLRYRLWDVDVLINRTLVYGALTLTLTGVFVGLVVGLQALLRGVISQDSGVAIALSTLVIYVLFQPLRRRLQALIDRRFYRRRYDAAKILAAFSATLRQEVDLDTLRAQVLAVAQETMQPAQASLWLRPSPQRERGGGTAHRRAPPGTAHTALNTARGTEALTGTATAIKSS